MKLYWCLFNLQSWQKSNLESQPKSFTMTGGEFLAFNQFLNMALFIYFLFGKTWHYWLFLTFIYLCSKWTGIKKTQEYCWKKKSTLLAQVNMPITYWWEAFFFFLVKGKLRLINEEEHSFSQQRGAKCKYKTSTQQN